MRTREHAKEGEKFHDGCTGTQTCQHDKNVKCERTRSAEDGKECGPAVGCRAQTRNSYARAAKRQPRGPVRPPARSCRDLVGESTSLDATAGGRNTLGGTSSSSSGAGEGYEKRTTFRPAARRELKITVQRCPTSAFGASQSWRSCGKQRATFLKTNEKKRHVGWMMSRCFRSSRKKKSVETAEILVTLARE